jgi:hypothetical protein
MADRVVEHPISGRECFKRTGDAAAQSQAALLLLLGRQLRGDDSSLVARAAATGTEGFVDPVPEEDLAVFEVPRLRPTRERFGVRRMKTNLRERFGSPIADTPVGAGEAKRLRAALSELAEELYKDPDPAIAAQLMEAALQHPHELTRVAAASSYFELSTRPKRLISILVEGTKSEDELVREVAATALARVAPENTSLRALMKGARSATTRKPSRTSLLVHGTFAKNGDWWQPGGDFHEFILKRVRPDLYGAADRFDWSGGYSDSARSLAAAELSDWVEARGLAGLDIFAHSHGANVAMLASQSGLNIGTLVLLSCPVHIHKYAPNPANIARTVSVRVRLDLVILADRGGQRFNHPDIEEHVLPVWFNHSATHERKVWKKHKVKAMLGL